MSGLSVIILTHNEEKHIGRCLDSLRPMTDKVFIVDSFSTDRTVEIARVMGAIVVQNPWLTYATQFNYGIQHTPHQTTWLMRMDADEYVLPELAAEIRNRFHERGLRETPGAVHGSLDSARRLLPHLALAALATRAGCLRTNLDGRTY